MLNIREQYGPSLAQGCGIPEAALPWEVLEPVLIQRKLYFDRMGMTNPAQEIDGRDLALVCAFAGCVRVPDGILEKATGVRRQASAKKKPDPVS